MRTYAPAATEAVLARLLEEPSLARGVIHHAVISRPARRSTGPWPDVAGSADLRAGLEARGIERLYTHQAEAVEAVHAGEDIVVVTPTASGKTLCYALPVLQAIAEDPAARALFLFPTKALGQDQVAEFARAVAGGRADDLGGDLRRRHAGADPVGDPQGRARSSSRTRTCSTRRSSPTTRSGSSSSSSSGSSSSTSCTRTAACSAATSRTSSGGCSGCAPTTAATRSSCAARRRSRTRPSSRTMLTGRPPRLDRPERRAGRRAARPARRPAAARRGDRGARARPLTLAHRWALPFLRAGRQTIVFGRSADRGRDHADGAARGAPRGPRAAVAGPRLPRRLPADGAAGDRARPARRRDPRRRRDERARARASTSAASTSRSSPAIRARSPATWQQIGRAGRRSETSVGDPRRVGGAGRPVRRSTTRSSCSTGTPEEARLDPDNLHVLLAHLRCATFELPFEPGEVFGPGPADDLLAFIAESGHVRQAERRHAGTGARRTSRPRRSRCGPRRRRTS